MYFIERSSTTIEVKMGKSRLCKLSSTQVKYESINKGINFKHEHWFKNISCQHKMIGNPQLHFHYWYFKQKIILKRYFLPNVKKNIFHSISDYEYLIKSFNFSLSQFSSLGYVDNQAHLTCKILVRTYKIIHLIMKRPI